MLFRPIPLKSLIATVAFALVGVLGQGGVVHAASGSSAKTSKSAKAPVKKASKPKLATRSVKKVNTAKRKQSVDSRKVKLVKAAPTTKPRAQRIKHTVPAVTPPVMSMGQSLGLHGIDDELDLNASVALVVDQRTNEVLFSKNDSAVLPIASLTKLMTGLVVVEAGQNMDETITITRDDIDTIKGSRSRLAVGTRLTRGEAMHLALMSSENRAANALGRHFPGGLDAFVKRMNDKAAELGMHDTRYVEPTGLSSRNQSSAQDLALLVNAASADATVRQLSTSPEYQVEVGNRMLQFNTTNRLVKSPDWDIGVQKTGYISEAGQCLVVQTRLKGRNVIMVLLDSASKISRIRDAELVRRWLRQQPELAGVAGGRGES